MIVGLVLALVFYAVLTNAWTFLFVLAVLAAVYAWVHRKPHATHKVRITETGIQWDGESIVWSQVNGYWMLQGLGYVELHVELKRFGRKFVVQTGSVTPEQIHAVLSKYIPSFNDRKENILDYIIRICKL